MNKIKARVILALIFDMNKIEPKEFLIITGVPLILFLFCLVFANWILPEHCSLFDDNVLGGQTCHTIPMPAGCENICEDRATASVASTIVSLGICLFFLPFLIFAIKYLRNRPVSQTKLFD